MAGSLCALRVAAAQSCRLLLLALLSALLLSTCKFDAAATRAGSTVSICQSLDPSPSLVQFVDPLPLPLSINLSSQPHLTLGAYKIMQKLHRDLPATPMYAFGTSPQSASSPGPTLLATQHVPAYIQWENHIDDATHILTVDYSIHWANPTQGGVPIVVHLHGGEVDSASDGHPDAWFTYKGDTGTSFSSANNTYVNEQLPMALWYHDHTIGITRLNVVAGLSGMYIITSPAELEILPVGLPLVIQDRQFYDDGTVNFPNIGIVPSNHENWCPEYFGDTIVVNGKIWPFLKVLPRAYRFRILNACNARFLVLALDNPNMYLYQIGTDGGLVSEPWNLTSITMAPAERVDVVIDFSGLPNGTSVILNNSGATPFPSGDIYQMPPKTYDILQFIIDEEDGCADGALEEDDMSRMDFTSVLKDEKEMSEADAVATRILDVVEYDDSNYLPLQFTLDNRTWEDPVMQAPVEGTTEIWELTNWRINAHPIHIHLVQFQVLNQQTFLSDTDMLSNCSFDIAYGEDGTCFTEAPREPYPYQRGWKDTVITWPSVMTRVLIRFTQRDGSAFTFDPSKGPGYAWHCHIVDHEDNVMMRPFVVTANLTLAALTRDKLRNILDPQATL